MTTTVSPDALAAAHRDGTEIDGFRIFLIPVDLHGDLARKVKAINKRADKLVLPPVEYSHTGVRIDREITVGGSIAAQVGSKLTYQAEYVMLKGNTPVIEGWEFAAVVHHRPAGNEFNSVTGEYDLSDFNFADRVCHQCNTKRVRNATYLVRNVSGADQMVGTTFILDGEFAQVGSSCLRDFVPNGTPQQAAAACENILKLFHWITQPYTTTAGRTTRKFFLTDWLAVVSQVVREEGEFVSKAKAWHPEQATANIAKARILALLDGEAETPSNEDYESSEDCITWVRDYDTIAYLSGSDYGDQLIAATKSDEADVDESRMGITASIFAARARYNREVGIKAEQARQDYIGQVKEKVTLTDLTVERVHSFQTQYGFTTLYTFKTSDGNVVQWFASRDQSIDKGDSVSILIGTVKKHEIDSYTGNKVTVLTRCKLV